MEKLTETIVAQNVPPAGDYGGPDAAALKGKIRALWAKNFPNVKLVKVGLRGSSVRTSGWKWDDARRSWFRFDASRLRAYAIADNGNPKFVYSRSAGFTRDHMDNGELDTQIQMWDPKERM